MYPDGKDELNITREQITGLILAGGRARRMGGEDKGLLTLHDRPLVEHVIERLEGQVGTLLICANRHLDRYRATGHPVISDTWGEYAGPLAGILSGMQAATTPWLLVTPCDAPRLPADLAKRLATVARPHRPAIPYDGQRLQPLFGLYPSSLAGDLRFWLEKGERRVHDWIAWHDPLYTGFSDNPEAFANINTPEQLASMEAGTDAG